MPSKIKDSLTNMFTPEEQTRYHIIAMGNANLDLFATIPKLPIEDEKIRISELIKLPGGSASNYAVSVSRLGGKCLFFGHIGGDSAGQQLNAALQREGVDTTHIITEQKMETGFAFIATTVTGAHVILSYRGANDRLDPSQLPMDSLRKCSLLHLSSIPLEIIGKTIKMIQGTAVLLSLDPGRDALIQGIDKIRLFLQKANLLFVNKVEYEILMGDKPTLKSISELAQQIKAIVSVQRGEKGVLISNGTQSHKVQAFDVDVVDTTGAGDTYTSACTLALLRGYTLEQAAIYGSAAAGLNCQRLGARAGMPTHPQTIKFINRKGFPFPDYPMNPNTSRFSWGFHNGE